MAFTHYDTIVACAYRIVGEGDVAVGSLDSTVISNLLVKYRSDLISKRSMTYLRYDVTNDTNCTCSLMCMRPVTYLILLRKVYLQVAKYISTLSNIHEDVLEMKGCLQRMGFFLLPVLLSTVPHIFFIFFFYYCR